jgi:tetratricopeptide (TPR) repeat protein
MSELAAQLRIEIDNQIHNASFERVLDVCGRALSAARKHDDRAGEAVALYGLAAAHRYRGKYYEARVFNEEGALKLARELREGELIVDAIIQSAEIKLMGSFQYYDAREDFREALGIAHVMGYGRGLAGALIGLAAVYTALEQLTIARNYAREGLEFARELQLYGLQSKGLNVLGGTYARERNYEMALQCHQHALAISREYEQRLTEAAGLYHIGRIISQANAESGVIYLRQSLKLAEDTDYNELQYMVLSAIGETHLGELAFSEARSAFDKMLALASHTDNKIFEAYGYLHLGRLALAQRDFDLAIDHFGQMLTLTRERNNPVGEALALEWQAGARAAIHAYAEAIDSYQQARNVYVALDDEPNARRLAGQLVLMYVLAAFDRVLRLLRIRQ